MNPKNTKYIQDLYQLIETVPYGTIDIQIKRVDRKTAQITTTSEETLRYVDNLSLIHI